MILLDHSKRKKLTIKTIQKINQEESTMGAFEIIGGKKLKGEITPQGAKNEALQVINAVLLTDKEVIINNIPDIIDVNKLIDLLKTLGVKIKKLSEDKWLSLNQDNPQILNELFELENKKITYQLAYSLFIEMWYYGPEVIRFSNGFRQLSVNDDFENNVIKKRKSIKNYFKNYDRNVDINIFKSLLPIYLKHLDNSLESQSINNQINKYSNVNEFVEYLFDKSKFSKLESVEKLLNMNEKGLLKALEKDPLAKFSDEIYNHFRQEILPIYWSSTLLRAGGIKIKNFSRTNPKKLDF